MQALLYSAPLFYVGSIAEHHWLVISDAHRSTRWEVWQHADAGGDSWGYLHRDLLLPSQAVGRGPTKLLARWSGLDAKAIALQCERSPHDYPWCHRYRMWPGPNSNTYVQWVLGPLHRLGWKAIGKSYARFARSGPTQGERESAGTAPQVENGRRGRSY